MQLLKLEENKNVSLNDYLEVSNSEDKYDVLKSYELNDYTAFNYYYSVAKPLPHDRIYLNIESVSNKVLCKNDSVFYCYSFCKAFSLRFKKESPYEIYGKPDKSLIRESLPLEVLIIKRKTALYFITLAPAKEDTKFNIGMLKAIFNLTSS